MVSVMVSERKCDVECECDARISVSKPVIAVHVVAVHIGRPALCTPRGLGRT